jgi:hypothetical protein
LAAIYPVVFLTHEIPPRPRDCTARTRLTTALWHWSYGRGHPGDEAQDYDAFTFAAKRRRSNSSTLAAASGVRAAGRGALSDYTTKFEVNDDEPLYDEDVHGATDGVGGTPTELSPERVKLSSASTGGDAASTAATDTASDASPTTSEGSVDIASAERH